MLKRLITALTIVLSASLFLAGCGPGQSATTPAATTTPAASTASPDGNAVQASPGEEFILPVNSTAVIKGEKLSFRFESVLTDSRCPKGAQCVWAGEAKCRLLAVLGDQAPVELVLTETGGTAGFSKSVWQDWTIEFQVQPYPEIEKTIAAADYKLLMKVTR